MNKLLLCLTAAVIFLPTESHSVFTSKDCMNATARLNRNMPDGSEKAELVENVARYCKGYWGQASSSVKQLVQNHLSPLPSPEEGAGAGFKDDKNVTLPPPREEGAGAGFGDDENIPLPPPREEGAGAGFGGDANLPSLPHEKGAGANPIPFINDENVPPSSFGEDGPLSTPLQPRGPGEPSSGSSSPFKDTGMDKLGDEFEEEAHDFGPFPGAPEAGPEAKGKAEFGEGSLKVQLKKKIDGGLKKAEQTPAVIRPSGSSEGNVADSLKREMEKRRHLMGEDDHPNEDSNHEEWDN